MLINEAIRLFQKLRLMHYRSMLGQVGEREGSLSATEAFSVDVIHILGAPTIKQFSDFLGISQPNATYKINSLISKGYIKKVPSEDDHREYHLHVADKFYSYYEENTTFLQYAVSKLENSHSEKELELFETMLCELNDAL